MNKFSKNLCKCFVCKKIFVEPVVLPCGNSVCKNCITINQQDDVKCAFCEEIHTVPSKGFPINKNLEGIIIEKEKDSVNSKSFKCSVRSLLRKVSDLENAIKNPADEAKEYCTELNRQVQLSVEEKILQINLIS